MANSAVSTESFGSEKKVEHKGRKLKVAVVGCGGISELHLRTFANMPEVEIVAGVDIKPERLAVMQEKFGIKKLYKDWKVMLKEVKPDAVDVCTPNGVHAQAAIDASNAGCHVITEKPMAMTPAECVKMIAAAKKAGKLLVTGFQYRYHPVTQMIKRFRDEGQFGNIMFVKCQALRRRGIPNWGV
ncbi:MAG: Gfo/Idh/MocA family oxidoreductase [bacterium]|jgi:predicted dehydrogenase